MVLRLGVRTCRTWNLFPRHIRCRTEATVPYFEEWCICAGLSNRKNLAADCLTCSCQVCRRLRCLPASVFVMAPIQPSVPTQSRTNWLLTYRSRCHVTKPSHAPKTSTWRQIRMSSLLIILIDNLYGTETAKGNLSSVSFQNAQIHTDGKLSSSSSLFEEADYVHWFFFLPPVCKKM